MAWQSGDGALANVALDRALADNPTYSMAALLRQVITVGTPPSMARLPMTPEEVAASYDDLEDPWDVRAPWDDDDFCDIEDPDDADPDDAYPDDANLNDESPADDGTDDESHTSCDHEPDADVRHLGIDGEA